MLCSTLPTLLLTTADPPEAKWMERLHRQPKASLSAPDDPENCWAFVPRSSRTLTVPPLNSCSAPPSDDLANPASCNRRSYQPPAPSPEIHADFFAGSAQAICPEFCVEKELATCSYVYVRCDRVRRPLEPLYDGPF
ncbi:hypothetical protein SprV_0100360200 [Sparganum proliferum]